MRRVFALLVALILMMSGAAVQAASIFVEAESFAVKGGWVVDQQFMDNMGSPYLLAHGMGRPVEDASTVVEIPRAGTWHVYVRTYNWTSPWTSRKGPGQFRVKLGGSELAPVVGCEGSSWEWQYAGSSKLGSGSVPLALSDITGFEGRCDALWLTNDRDDVPPRELRELAAFRRKALGLRAPSAESYDFVVVGGGIAGMCAAVAAARLGSRVALVNDRPVLGGNNSSEVRVHLGGHVEIGQYPHLGTIIREFGHSRKGNAQPADFYEDSRKQAFIDAEPLVTLYPSYRAVEVNMSGSRISSVLIKNIETSEEILLKAPIFSDCTGDAVIGFLAGADWRMGREARSEYGESLAPEKADGMTMGASIQWRTCRGKGETGFPLFEYGLHFADTTCEKVMMGEWQWETGMNFDQIGDAERIRDYGMLVVYSNWSYLKNRLADNARFSDRELEWVAYISGKRESRRLLGDYILKQEDIDKSVYHEDASFTASWSIDLHFPDPVNAGRFPEAPFKAATVHNWIYPCNVPYRCLYSRNVENLFMAGRNISVTHVALGTVRVMRTTGMMGEVVGMAASICRQHNCSPREVYRYHLPELRALMEKGAYKADAPLNDQNFNLPNRHLDRPKAFLKQ